MLKIITNTKKIIDDKRRKNSLGLSKLLDTFYLLDDEYQRVHRKSRQFRKQERQLNHERRRLKQYVFDEVQAQALTNICNENLSVSIRQAPEQLIIDHDALLPDKYVYIDKRRIIDKKAIKQDLQNGLAIPGAHLEHTPTLDIERYAAPESKEVIK